MRAVKLCFNKILTRHVATGRWHCRWSEAAADHPPVWSVAAADDGNFIVCCLQHGHLSVIARPTSYAVCSSLVDKEPYKLTF